MKYHVKLKNIKREKLVNKIPAMKNRVSTLTKE